MVGVALVHIQLQSQSVQCGNKNIKGHKAVHFSDLARKCEGEEWERERGA